MLSFWLAYSSDLIVGENYPLDNNHQRWTGQGHIYRGQGYISKN